MFTAIVDRATRYEISRANVIRRLIEEGLRSQAKLIPSASALEKQILTLSRDIKSMKETLAQYALEPATRGRPAQKTKGSS